MGPRGGRRRGGGRLWAQRGSGGHEAKGAMRGRGLHGGVPRGPGEQQAQPFPFRCMGLVRGGGGTAMGNLGAELRVIRGKPHRTHPIQGGPSQCHLQMSSSPALGTSMGRGWRTPPRLGGPGRRRRMRPSWRKVEAGGVAPQEDCGAGPRAPQKGRARGAAGGGQCHGGVPGTPHPPHPPPPRAPQPRGTRQSRAAQAGDPRGCGVGGGPRPRMEPGRGPAVPPAWGGGSEVLTESMASSPVRGRAQGARGNPNPNPPRFPGKKRRRARRRRSGRRNGALRERAALGCWGGA